MGGTFDPVHYGHLRISETAREQMGLDKVLFIPNRTPVHKDHVPASSEDRFAMLVLATQDHPQFEVSRMELDRLTPSFAVETLEALREEMPDADLFFITGADEILSLHKWKSSERLLELACFVAAPRPGYNLGALSETMDPTLLKYIRLLDMDHYPMTSTGIRADIAKGCSILYETPMAVVNYIYKRGLYLETRTFSHAGKG